MVFPVVPALNMTVDVSGLNVPDCEDQLSVIVHTELSASTVALDFMSKYSAVIAACPAAYVTLPVDG